MASLNTKLTVGLFVVIGFSMVIFAVVWLGMSNYLEKGKYYVAYFDESVQGLDRDSPVKYRGVSIGRVHTIGVAPDANLIQVVLKIETGLKLDKSIVAQLKSVGITGIMFVELEKKQDADMPASPRVEFPSRYPVIDTKPSEVKKFMDAVNDVLSEFKELDIKGISDGLQSTLAKMEQTMEEAQIRRLSDEMYTTLGDVRHVIEPERWERIIQSVGSAADNFDALSADGRQTIARANTSLESIDRLITENESDISTLISDMRASLSHINKLVVSSNDLVLQSNKEMISLMNELKKSLKNYEKAGKNLDRFLERIADQPSQLFLGEPPVEKSMGAEAK